MKGFNLNMTNLKITLFRFKLTRAMSLVNLFYIKNIYKKKFKSVRSFCKAIPKSLGFGCNV